MSASAGGLLVAHSVRRWLPETQNWIRTIVASLPPEVGCRVVCDERLDDATLPARASLSSFGDSPSGRLAARIPRLAERLRKRWLRRLLARERPALLHSHFGNRAWADLPVARRARVPQVVTFYGYDLTMLPAGDPRWAARYRELFGSRPLVLCEGPHMASVAVGAGCPTDRTRVQHLGVELGRFPFRPRRWSAGEELRILVAATFVEKKGIPYALAAIAAASRDSAPSMRVTLVGDASAEERSRAERARILAAIAELGLADRVELAGFLTHADMQTRAGSHHLLLSPSVTAGDGDTEGGAPVTLVEMAASGMPIVATTHCDIPNVVRHGEMAWLAAERDVPGLVAGIRWWVESPHAWPDRLLAARRRVEREFDARRQGERLATIYAEEASARQAPLR